VKVSESCVVALALSAGAQVSCAMAAASMSGAWRAVFDNMHFSSRRSAPGHGGRTVCWQQPPWRWMQSLTCRTRVSSSAEVFLSRRSTILAVGGGD
jgi:hypothetical protein